MAIRLVVGLGNPGPQYEATRHNVGFKLLDYCLASRAPAGAWRDWKGAGDYAETAEGAGKVFWAKPSTFMNESGRMVRAFADFFKIAPPEILVCLDDFAIPLAKLRLRLAGSAGGHNGLQSVLDHLGTQDVPRLRVGIGPLPEGEDPARFVLNPFEAREREALEKALARASGAVADSIGQGVERAMNTYNAPETAEP